MDDALLVSRLKGLRDLFRNRECLIDRDRATGDALREIVTLDEFHDEGVLAGRFLDRVDRGDVGMIQRGERFGLALESGQALGVGREGLRQDLDRDLTTERRVRRPMHLPHAALADGRGDFVDAEAGAGGEGQRWRDYMGGGTVPTG